MGDRLLSEITDQIGCLTPGQWFVWPDSDSGWWFWRGVRVDGLQLSGSALTRWGARLAARRAVGSRG